MPPTPTTPETPQGVVDHLSTLDFRPETIEAQMSELNRRCQNFRNSEQLTLVIMALRRKEEAASTNAVARQRLQGMRRDLEGRLSPSFIQTNPSQPIVDAFRRPETITGRQNPASGTDTRNLAAKALVAVGTATGVIALFNFIKNSRGIGDFFKRVIAGAVGVFGLSALLNARQRAVAQGVAEQGRTVIPFNSEEASFGTGPSALRFARQPNGSGSEIVVQHDGRRYRLMLPRVTVPGSTTPTPEENLSAAVTGLSQLQSQPDTLSLDIGNGPRLAIPGLLQLGDRQLRLDLTAAGRQAITDALRAPAPANGRRTASVPFRINTRGLSAQQVQSLSAFSTSAPARQEGDTLILTMDLRLEDTNVNAPTTTTATPDGGLNGVTIPNATARSATIAAPRASAVSMDGTLGIAANGAGEINDRGVRVTRGATGDTLQVEITATATPGARSIRVGTRTITFTIAAPATMPEAATPAPLIAPESITNGTELLSGTGQFRSGRTYAFALPATNPQFSVQVPPGAAFNQGMLAEDGTAAETTRGELRCQVIKQGGVSHLVVRAGANDDPLRYNLSVGTRSRHNIRIEAP